MKALRAILALLLVLNLGTCVAIGGGWNEPMSWTQLLLMFLGIIGVLSVTFIPSSPAQSDTELEMSSSDSIIEEEHIETTICKRCKRTRRCNYFPLVLAHVIKQVSTTSPIGGTGYEIKTETTYRKIGSGGAYFCRICQIYNWIKRMVFPLIIGIAPLIILVVGFVFPGTKDYVRNYTDPFWFTMFPILILVFGGIILVPFFFLYLIAFKGGSYEAAEELCADEIKKKYRVGFVATEQIYSGGAGTRDIQLFRKSTYDNLSRQ